MSKWNGSKSSVEICVLDGGKMPKRKTKGAAGYDVFARAVVSQDGELDPRDDRLRKTLFNFMEMPEDPALDGAIITDPDNCSKLAYVMKPNDHALVGIGFATALPEDMMMWLTPRSGLSMRRMTLTNAPGTIDSDYRGEAGALLVNNSGKEFVLQHQMRIAQVIFTPVFLPELISRASIDELSLTERGSGGFGSTGLMG